MRVAAPFVDDAFELPIQAMNIPRFGDCSDDVTTGTVALIEEAHRSGVLGSAGRATSLESRLRGNDEQTHPDLPQRA